MYNKFRHKRNYQGPIEAVILDWAGTTMDHGCMAPAVVFVDVFEKEGVPITMEEARIPMGARKDVHIKQITEIDTVKKRWKEKFERDPNQDDVNRMFQNFIPLQLECLSNYSQLIPGTKKIVDELKSRGMKIGSTTGYLTDMVKINLEDGKKQGYEPDSTVCASDVPQGRPYPYMCLLNAINLGVTSVEACVKVDDTIPGIKEGLNVGMWTIGLATSGNEIGLPLDEMKALPKAEFETKRAKAYKKMYQCGAHYVVDSIADMLPCIDSIQQRINQGDRP